MSAALSGLLFAAATAGVRRVVYLGGIFPADEKALRALPGVGPYTARAVLAFAFEADVAPVDTNVLRVLTRCIVEQRSRLFGQPSDSVRHRELIRQNAMLIRVQLRSCLLKTLSFLVRANCLRELFLLE